MAELDTSGRDNKKGKSHKTKKASTRVDLTPMVDLAFLLVTFFMLTTTFSKPQTMEINMPVRDISSPESGQAVKESKTMTILLGPNDEVYYYLGITKPEVNKTDYSGSGIRKILLEKKSSIKDFVVLIKPMETSTYRNVIDILDEMNITGIGRYALVDITPFDLELVKEQIL